jgi:FkbM family methyltransferase
MTPYLAAQHGEAVFIVSTRSGGGEKLFVQNARRSEFVCLERVCMILREAGKLTEPAVIVDVGAHIGTTTVPALTLHGFARAVAVEPDPDNIRLLRVNVALNGLHERVRVIQAAVSDTPRKQMLWSPGIEEGGWAKGRLIEESSPTAVVIDTVTLDGLAEANLVEPETTKLLWLAHTFDESVARSASVFLQRRVPIVFVLRRHTIAESGSFLGQLRENGYERVVDLRRPSLNEPLSSWTPTFEPVDALSTLSPRKKLTDVLVF